MYNILSYFESQVVKKCNEGNYFSLAEQAVIIAQSEVRGIDEKIKYLNSIIEAIEQGQSSGEERLGYVSKQYTKGYTILDGIKNLVEKYEIGINKYRSDEKRHSLESKLNEKYNADSYFFFINRDGLVFDVALPDDILDCTVSYVMVESRYVHIDMPFKVGDLIYSSDETGKIDKIGVVWENTPDFEHDMKAHTISERNDMYIKVLIFDKKNKEYRISIIQYNTNIYYASVK